MSVEILAPLRHTCTACGGSCEGSFVFLRDQAEADRVVRFAEELGVSEPIEGGRLREIAGRCVFLGEDQLCAIHKRWGLAAKPAVCRQYPLVGVRAEGVVRVGIDPGCYAVHATRSTAPEVPAGALILNHFALGPEEAAREADLIDLLDHPLAEALAPLVGGADRVPGFLGRWVTTLKAVDLPAILQRPETPTALRASLAPLADAIGRWKAEAPPAWPALDEDTADYLRDAAQRMVHLRLGHESGLSVMGFTLLCVAGAWAVAAADPRPEAIARTLPGWLRAVRIRGFASALVPDEAALRALVLGR